MKDPKYTCICMYMFALLDLLTAGDTHVIQPQWLLFSCVFSCFRFLGDFKT